MTESDMSGAKKAAILMVLLGDEASAGIFRFMQEDEIQEISKEISRLGEINHDVADEILEEVKAFKVEAINWLKANHPELLKGL